MANITLRPAKSSEVPAIIDLELSGFGLAGPALAFFPNDETRLDDWLTFRRVNAQAGFEAPGRHYVVATEPAEDGTEQIVGAAEWIAPGGPDPDSTPEDRKAKQAELKKHWPTSLDMETAGEFGKTVGAVITAALVKAGLPEDAGDGMWDLNSIAVDSNHQRKGIGRRLVQWGLDRAAETGNDVLIIANPTGALLYKKMGLELLEEADVFVGKPYERREHVFLWRHRK